MLNIVKTALTAGAAAVGLCLCALPASAADREAISFSYDLDRARVATPAGAAEIYAELTDQAREACRVTDRRSLYWREVDNACAADLVEKTVAAAGAPLLSRRHADLTGPSAPALAEQMRRDSQPES